MFRFCLQHHPPLELLLPQEPRSTQEHLRKTQSLLGPRVKFSTHVSRSRLVPKCPKCDRPCDLFQHKTNMQTHTKHKLPLLREKSWGEGQLKGWVILRAEAVFPCFCYTPWRPHQGPKNPQRTPGIFLDAKTLRITIKISARRRISGISEISLGK